MPWEETEIAMKIAYNIQHAENKAKLVHDAWKLAEGLKDFRPQEDDKEEMWCVIQGVWLEMLCFSAGRCRGYLHAKSLGQGGEYLSYVWLLMSYMGMETLGEKMQRTKLQEEASNNGTAAASTTVTATGGSSNSKDIPVPATGGDHGYGGAKMPRQRKSRSLEDTPVAQQWLLHP